MELSPKQAQDPEQFSAAQMDDSGMMAAAQLVFAERRTALALLRTGIAVLALPLAVVSALIATSKFYDAAGIAHLFIPVMILNVVLVVFGIFLIVRSITKLRRQDRWLETLKQTHPAVAPFFD